MRLQPCGRGRRVRPRPRAVISAAALVALAPAALPAQQSTSMNAYTLGWDNAASHLYDVSLTFPSEGRDSVDVHLPVWRPGRYIRQNYAANVQEFTAHIDGDPRPVRKVGLSTWRVAVGPRPESADVTVRYRYYANTLDAGASLLSPAEAYFNPVNLFVYPDGQIGRPLSLKIDAPDGWQIATPLEREDGDVLHARDYHELADSPTIVSPDLATVQFTVDEVPYTMFFQGRFEPGERRERIAPDVERIVRVQTGIFGGAPFDEYTFLFHLVPYPFGHAVEHESSSSYVIQDNAFETDATYADFLGIIAHELFHAWNVKRIRPAALWPYDYMREQFTSLHWFTEGVTSYYAGLTLRRAGLSSPDEFLSGLSEAIDGLQRTPGRKLVSVAAASWDSWLSGYGQGNPNLTVNFYGKGQVLGFLLDALIRDRTDGARSLDDVFRLLYENAYRQNRGVPEDGVREAVEQVAGTSFEEFFARYVDGTEELPYDEVLRPFGLTVRSEPDPERPAATLRVSTRPQGEHAVVASIDPESPALGAGLDVGDAIVAVNGVTAPAQGWEALLAGVKPGEAVRLTVLRRNRLLEVPVEVEGGGNLRWKVERREDVDERQQRLFNQWIGDPQDLRGS